MKKKMKVKDFVEMAKKIQSEYKTTYMWGVFGAPVSERIIQEKSRQYPDYYKIQEQNRLRKLIGTHFGFDCVCLIKGIDWGWRGDKGHLHGGAVYASGAPDLSADGMISVCTNVSEDFSKIEIGEAVWIPGHIGIYVGNGLVVEATPSWDNGVQLSTFNGAKEAKGKMRRWKKHGKLPFIDYSEPVQDIEPWKQILKRKVDSPDFWIALAEEYKDHPKWKYFPLLVEKIGK